MTPARALVQVARAALSITEYETTGAPLFPGWDEKFEAVRDALGALDQQRRANDEEPKS
jgi:hypothetical protein